MEGGQVNYPEPQCFDCARFKPRKGKWVCDAFHKGIPEDILRSKHNHKIPYEGDNGLMFVMSTTEEVQWDAPLKGGADAA
jgi:hypothetical protein